MRCSVNLTVVALQCVTILVKKVKSYQITQKQLQVLLAYAEEDIYDTTRQATAFGLLKVWHHQIVGLCSVRASCRIFRITWNIVF